MASAEQRCDKFTKPTFHFVLPGMFSKIDRIGEKVLIGEDVRDGEFPN
jgi:hypothetical protein